MFQLGKTIVSEELLKEEFVCNISSCKGECCVAGDAGAPLVKDEVGILDNIFEKVRPYMSQKGIDAVLEQGTSIVTSSGDLETPLVNDKECVYVVFDDKGVACCAIEKAYNSGIIDWKKPISCHLYPVRVQDYSEFSAVNYDRWSICSDACSLGKELKVPVYKFVKEALIRKFGKDWFDALEKVAFEHHGDA